MIVYGDTRINIGATKSPLIGLERFVHELREIQMIYDGIQA